MKYINFYSKLKKFPVFSLADVRGYFPDFDHRRLYEWQKKAYIKKIINNYYIFLEKNFNDNELCFTANKLYEPSYISLEFALSYYSLIPETVYWLTCVSSRKTKKICSFLANFSYRKINSKLFFGYKIIDSNPAFKIAEPEKALLDFLYFRKDIKNEDDIEGLRINKDIFTEIIDLSKMEKYLQKFSSPTMNKKYKILLKVINKQDA